MDSPAKNGLFPILKFSMLSVAAWQLQHRYSMWSAQGQIGSFVRGRNLFHRYRLRRGQHKDLREINNIQIFINKKKIDSSIS